MGASKVNDAESEFAIKIAAVPRVVRAVAVCSFCQPRHDHRRQTARRARPL